MKTKFRATNKSIGKSKRCQRSESHQEKYRPSSTYDEFKDLSWKISLSLKFFRPVIRGIIQ